MTTLFHNLSPDMLLDVCVKMNVTSITQLRNIVPEGIKEIEALNIYWYKRLVSAPRHPSIPESIEPSDSDNWRYIHDSLLAFGRFSDAVFLSDDVKLYNKYLRDAGKAPGPSCLNTMLRSGYTNIVRILVGEVYQFDHDKLASMWYSACYCKCYDVLHCLLKHACRETYEYMIRDLATKIDQCDNDYVSRNAFVRVYSYALTIKH